MTRKTTVWMPFYWGDYLRDTAHLDTLEHGAYMLLIGHYWINGKGIASADKRLAAVTGMTIDAWKEIKPTIKEFFTVEDGFWRHSRIDEEIKTAGNKAEARSDAGKRGAEVRWQTDSKRNAIENNKGNAPAIGNGNVTTMLSRATPSHSEVEETNANALAKKLPDIPQHLIDAANKAKGGNNGKRPGSRCPTDHEITEQDREYARSRNLDQTATNREWESYVAHFSVGQGRNKTASIWHGGSSHWGTWCRNAEKFAAERLSSRPSNGGAVSAARSLMDVP